MTALAALLLALQIASYASDIAYNGVRLDLLLKRPAPVVAASHVPAVPFLPGEAYVAQETGRVRFGKGGF
jgi:hypothetical protein